ncbi:MAG TPA: C39 family peptidase [Planctomycetaceae bacterium]|nr:C39 family peptidase [Planctomycetaceae bacterium]
MTTVDAGFPSLVSIRRRPATALGLAIWGGLIVAACAPSAVAAPPLDLASVKIAGVPHVKQRPDFCGEACAEMFLRKLKVPIDQDGVFEQSGLDPSLGRGCYTAELARALEKLGFKTGRVWYSIPAEDAWPSLNDEFSALHADLRAGVPSIVCMRYDDEPKSPEHFRLVLGYDSASDEVIYHDPALARGASLRMSRARFLRLWPLKDDAAKWTVVRLRLEPGDLIQPARRLEPISIADYAQHIRKLKPKVPEGFTLVLKRPFVVLGDETPDTVHDRVENTVDWAVSRLKGDYFERNPNAIIDIWLFADNVSYEEYTHKLFGEKPTTPYGFYSPKHHALIMNIATGGGTLVHEIVHPFIASNFPDCPSWFNEGLASLYEQAQDRNGHIAGLTNWRLRGLHAAIRDGALPSFEKLCSTTTREFYDDNRATNYAQARYLCYYLQEHGLLVKFYRAFHRNVTTDPTGIDTLKSILGEENLAEFQKQWEKYVMKLEFEP